MSSIIVYGNPACGYTQNAIKLLKQSQRNYKFIDLSNDPDHWLQLCSKTGQRTIPYVYINHVFIGGYTELYQTLSESK